MAVSPYFYWHSIGSSRGPNSSEGKEEEEIHIQYMNMKARPGVKKNIQEDCDVTFYDATSVCSEISFPWNPRSWILSIAPLSKLDGVGGTKWNCEVTKVPMLEHESSLISIGCIAFWRRLPNWAVLEAYWGIQDAHHNKMLMEDTKHCADRISIRGLLTVKEGEGWSQRALIPPASLSTLGVGGGGFPWRGGCGGLGPMASSISASAWPHLGPLDERQRARGRMKEHGSEERGIGPNSSGRPHSTSLKHS